MVCASGKMFLKIAGLFCLITPSIAIMMNSTSEFNDTDFPETGDVFSECWRSQSYFQDVEQLAKNVGHCVKHRMYIGLSENIERECIDIGDGVSYIQSSEESAISPRDLFPLGEEPSTVRGLMDAYSTFLTRRGMRWDLGHLYPGLVMSIGPTLGSDGILQFDSRPLNKYERTHLGPGQHLLKRTLLPQLLGFRMNIMALLPLIFGILIYVAKNAVIFSKLTLIISTVLALKSLFILQHLRPPNSHYNDPLSDTSVSASEINGIGHRPIIAQPHSLRPEVVLQMFGSAVPFRGVNDQNKYPVVVERGTRNFAWEK